MQTDLVRAPCHEMDTNERKGAFRGLYGFERLIVRLDGQRAHFRALGIAHLVSFVVFDEVAFQNPRKRRLPVNESLIDFREGPRLDERIHFLQPTHGLARDD